MISAERTMEFYWLLVIDHCSFFIYSLCRGAKKGCVSFETLRTVQEMTNGQWKMTNEQ